MPFVVKATKVGSVIIKVTATTDVAGDAIERVLPVKAEGAPQYENQAIFADLRTQTTFSNSFDIVIPNNAVSNSTKVSVSIVGKIIEF